MGTSMTTSWVLYGFFFTAVSVLPLHGPARDLDIYSYGDIDDQVPPRT